MTELFYPFLLLASFIAFLYGVVRLAQKKTDDIGRKKAKLFMFSGGGVFFLVIAIFVAMSFMQTSFGVSSMDGGYAPSFASPSGGARVNIGLNAKSVAYDAVQAVANLQGMPPTEEVNVPMGETKIIKNASLTLLVKSVPDAANAITALRTRYGGQPGNASFSEYGSGSRSGSMTIWVPANNFDSALKDIKLLAIRVGNETVTTEDVSAQFVDMTARLTTLKATEAQLLLLMQRAGKISEILEVERELTNTRTQIEQYQGQLNYLEHQVAQSSISISLSEEASAVADSNEWRPWSKVKLAIRGTLADMTNFVDMVIALTGKLPGLIINFAFFGAIIWLLFKLAFHLYGKLKNRILPRSGGEI